MARPKKRTRIAPKKTATGKLHIREITESKDGYEWITYLVQGWKEGGKWKRLKFKDKRDAERFVAKKQVELLNDEKLNNVTTRLSREEVEQAEIAFKRLGGRYTLDHAITYFLANFAEPEEKVEVGPAIAAFLDAKEAEGVRPRSLVQLRSSLGYQRPGEKERTGGFKAYADRLGLSCVHEIAPETVEGFLKSLRGRDGKTKASRKTWNNYRADLHSFLAWCADPRRRWVAENPVAGVFKWKPKQIARGVPETLTASEAAALMRFVENYKGGRLVRYFALALFAGIRTGPEGELHKLAGRSDLPEVIDLRRGEIRIPPEVSKTGELRKIKLRSNLRRWLLSAPAEILPPNHDRDVKTIRKKFGLGHDVLRHSFFSHHVAAFDSVGQAALEGGNTETVVRKHYLNLANHREGPAFWKIAPAKKTGAESKIIQLAS